MRGMRESSSVGNTVHPKMVNCPPGICFLGQPWLEYVYGMFPVLVTDPRGQRQVYMAEHCTYLVFFFSIFQNRGYHIFRLLSGLQDLSNCIVNFYYNIYIFKHIESKLIQQLLLGEAACFFHQIHCVWYNAVLHEKIKMFALSPKTVLQSYINTSKQNMKSGLPFGCYLHFYIDLSDYFSLFETTANMKILNLFCPQSF